MSHHFAEYLTERINDPKTNESMAESLKQKSYGNQK